MLKNQYFTKNINNLLRSVLSQQIQKKYSTYLDVLTFTEKSWKAAV
jgi:hypothetical protein